MIKQIQISELERCLFVIRESFATVAKEFNITDLSLNNDNSRVIRYLNKDRRVGRSIIQHLLDNKLLLQENYTNNAIFLMYDEENNLVGAELQGTVPNIRYNVPIELDKKS